MKRIILSCLWGMLTQLAFSQAVSINETGAPPAPSAILDVASTNKGILVPRMSSSQRTSISSPADGLLVYDLTTDSFWFYDGGWNELTTGAGVADADGDTRIQVEASPDEDKIRLQAAGEERVVVDSTGLLAPGSFISSYAGPIPATGGGTRLMWIPQKAAFRAGRVDLDRWDLENIGDESFIGGGFDHEASGNQSFIGGGLENFTSGQRAFVGGGALNLAFGRDAGILAGSDNNVGGNEAFVGGGFFNLAFADRSFIAGGDNNATDGNNSFVGGGTNLTAYSFCEAVFGLNATEYTPINGPADRLFNVGNGTSSSPSERSDAFTILKNGSIGINQSSPASLLHIINDKNLSVSFQVDQNYEGFAGFGGLIEVDGEAGALRGLQTLVKNTSGEAIGHFVSSSLSSSGQGSTIGTYTLAENPLGFGSCYGLWASVNPGPNIGSAYAGYFEGDVFTTGVYLPSDIALKREIQMASSVLDKVMQLQVATYTYDRQGFPALQLPSGKRTGLIAQNVASLMPELVKETIQPVRPQAEPAGGAQPDHATHFQAVDYAGMVPYLIKGMQEQQAMIEAQQDIITGLQASIKQLENRQK